MSGDVQPRKRKDKKKKKDDLCAPEEPRGTAAVFGEGDVLIHSQHDHGTGGHWCAKIIFFSLLAVLITLIALIILENRGLSEMEASSVESRYSAVLEGWLEEPSDDHHDEHTLELSHPTENEHDLSEDEAEQSEEQDVELEDIEHEPEEIEEEHITRTHFAEPYQPPEDGHDDDDDEQLTFDDDGDDNDEEPEQLEPEINDDDAGDNDSGSDNEDFLENDELLGESDDNNDDQDADELDNDKFDDDILDGGNEVPYEEVEESTEQLPKDSLLEEEEYEREQEELRKAEEEEGHKDGAQMIPEEEWGEEPNEERWRHELDMAQHEMNRGAARAALARAGAPALAASARARWLIAHALDKLAEEKKDNGLLERTIQAYIHLIQNHRLPDDRLKIVAERVIDRARFRGTPLAAEPAHRALVSRFPHLPQYRNQLVISCLMANRLDLATEELKTALSLWPEDGPTLAHYGFVLKMKGDLQEAVLYLERALSNLTASLPDEAKFHYHLGDALLQLERREEAHKVHVRAAKLGFFKSPEQRSLYNVDRLRSEPWWDLEKTQYRELKRELEASWRLILAEGEAASASYQAEREGLRTSGEWSQLELLSRGREVGGRCARAPVACGAARRGGAADCRRGQTKFSLLSPGARVRPHTGPTNCRLRVHLALANTDGAYIRVHNETRQWEVGRVLAFDDSFEHEVWHNGTAPRLVLIVDVWHPDLTQQEKLLLAPI